MSDKYVPELGKIIEGEAYRDAVHIAVAPAVAGESLRPGERIGFVGSDTGVAWRQAGCDMHGAKAVGIVDPFLDVAVVAEG
jgi:hypothetical protein